MPRSRMHLPGLLAAALAASALAGPVMTWVPPYSVSTCKTKLQKDMGGGIGMKDGLTFLGLQFWVTDGPNVKQWGAVAGSQFDGHVKWFRDWGKANNVKVLLCVVNHVGGWSCPEARRSFIDNRPAFVNSLMAEVDRHGLDGIDLDLECPNSPTQNDITQYLNLVRELGARLAPQGKVLTVDSYAAQYNFPNWTIWPELMKTVAAVNSMGYNEAGMNSPAGWKYPEQKKRAIPPHRLTIGMMGNSGSWQGNTAAEHIDWVVNDGQVGLSIWDAALGNAVWESAATWQKLKRIRDNTPTYVTDPRKRVDATLAKLTVRPANRGLFADFALPARGEVRVRIFDAKGDEVAELFRGTAEKGLLSLHWDGANAARGPYLISANVDGNTSTQKFSLIR